VAWFFGRRRRDGRAARRVFLSGTSNLASHPRPRPYTAAAEAAVSRVHDAVVNMAYFTARAVGPADYSMEMVEAADVYVGIIGRAYGSPVRSRPELSVNGAYTLPGSRFRAHVS
jgi:uncharacterized protein DUF4062